jgi:glycolate oxidase
MNAPQDPSPLQRTERQAAVVRALSAVLPAHALLWHNEDTVPYECDGLTAYRQRPLVVALPETEAQVQAVLKACHALEVPVVARGAGTGLSGGAMPHALGVTLSLAKFKPHPQDGRPQPHGSGAMRRAQPGHQRGCRPPGPVLRARPVQPDCLHHWRQRGRELGRCALPQIRPDAAQRDQGEGFHGRGRAVEFGGDALDVPGLDLLPLIVGSEGMLAITTEVTVKLVPKPQLARCIMASFNDIRKAGDAVASVIAEGIIPAGLEMMDKPMTAAVEDFVHAGYDLTAEAILLCESEAHPKRWKKKLAA